MFWVVVDNEEVQDDDLCFFTPLLARSLGLPAAVLIQYFHINLREPTYVVDDVPWLERSYDQLAEQERMSSTTIQRTMKKLENLKLVQSAQLRRKSWNHTKSYTLSYPDLLPLLQELYRDHVAKLERQKKMQQQ